MSFCSFLGKYLNVMECWVLLLLLGRYLKISRLFNYFFLSRSRIKRKCHQQRRTRDQHLTKKKLENLANYLFNWRGFVFGKDAKKETKRKEEKIIICRIEEMLHWKN